MSRKRKIGTFSTGVVFVFFGVLFLISIFMKDLDYTMIFSFWPIVLILLGVELILSFVLTKEESLSYDKGAVFLLLIMTIFTLGMASVDFILKHDMKVFF